MSTITDAPQRAARLYPTDDLAGALDPFARDYAAAIMLARQLPPVDARRCRQKARGRYARLLRQTIRSTEWLVANAPSEIDSSAS